MRYPKKNNRNNFYSTRSTQVPDLPDNTSTPSHFPNQKVSGIKPTTAFSKIKNFDAKLDKIDINIKGAAPIFGESNTIKSYTLGSEVGNFTGSLNNVYFNEEFDLLATVTRKARLSYWGVDTSLEFEIRPVEGRNLPTPLDVIRYKAYDTWLRNVAGLVTMLKQSMYTDLNIFNWLFTKTRIKAQSDANNKRFPVPYERVFQDPIAQLLINYQHDIQLVAMLVFRFEYLNAILPKLTTFYRKKADMFIYLQQQLRRSLYTAPVKSLMMWLKQRYVDKKYIQDYVLPLTILSKETDGLNSPIKYLSLINYTPMNCVKYGVDGVTYMPIFIGIQDLLFTPSETKNFEFNIWDGETQITEEEFNKGVDSGTGSHSDTYAYIESKKNDLYYGSLRRELDAFDMSTLLTTIEESETIVDFRNAIDAWLATARNTLETFQIQTLDMVRSQLIIDLETAIAKLATEPGGIQWEQNIEFSSLIAIEKFDNWTLVGDLVTFNASKPKYYDNGYTLRIPMYSDTGISINEMKTYSQAWFLPSNEKYMSFLELENDIKFTLRGDGTIYTAEVRYYTGGGDYQMPYLHVNANYYDTRVIGQLPFGSIHFQDNKTHYNPRRMSYIVATFDNKWPEFVLEAIRSFIVPQG